jgi:alkylation response protein AidB-like acyl-CoA dehydrogenase
MIEAWDIDEPTAERVAGIRRHLSARRAALERMDEADELPAELDDWMWSSGLLTLALPGPDGCAAPTASLCACVEELARHSGGLSLLALAQATGVMAVALAADAEQRARYAQSVQQGHFIAFALSETRAGSDARNLETRIVDRGDHLAVSGAKWLITNAWGAEHFVVFGRHVHRGDARGVSAVVLDRGMPGLQVAARNDLFGMRGVPTASLIMKDVRVPKCCLIGRAGEGFALAMRALDRSRPLVGAQAVGLGRAALDLAVQHCRRRQAFGRPLAGLDGVRLMVADMAVAVEASRLLVRRAAQAVDAGRPEASAASAAAKFFATDTAMRVAVDSIQLLGGYGCFRGRAPERILRDAKVTQIYEGANQIQRLVVGRHVLEGPPAAPPEAPLSAEVVAEGSSEVVVGADSSSYPALDGLSHATDVGDGV